MAAEHSKQEGVYESNTHPAFFMAHSEKRSSRPRTYLALIYLWGCIVAGNIAVHDARLVMVSIIIGTPPVFLLALRYNFYRRLFGEGEETVGRITRLCIDIDPAVLPGSSVTTDINCRIEYSYSFHERSYHEKSVVKGKNYFLNEDWMDIELLKPGDEISLLVDPAQPERSILRDLFGAGTETLLYAGKEEKSPREAFAAFETDKGPGTVPAVIGWLAVGLFVSLLPAFAFFSYFSYQPLTAGQITQVTGHFQKWSIERHHRRTSWGESLRIRTHEYPHDFIVDNELFKPYFDFARFKNEVKDGEELVFGVPQGYVQRIGTRDAWVYVDTVSSRKGVYLSLENAVAWDRKNHKWGLYLGLGSSLIIIGAIIVIRRAMKGSMTRK